MGVVLSLREGHLLMGAAYFLFGALAADANASGDAFTTVSFSLLFVVLVIAQFIIDTRRQNRRFDLVPPVS